MSAIVFTVILVLMLLISFSILIHYSRKRNWKAYDRVVVCVTFVIFLFMAANTISVGAYGYNTIRNNGENSAGLSLSRN
jgi:small-conductance mechanosensitive channel